MSLLTYENLHFFYRKSSILFGHIYTAKFSLFFNRQWIVWSLWNMLCCAKLLQSCLDCLWRHDLPGSSVQARILEWVAMPSSRGSSPPRDQTHVSNVCRLGREVLYHWRRLGSRSLCLALGNKQSEKMQVLTKQKTLLERGAPAESIRVREPRRSALPRGS